MSTLNEAKIDGFEEWWVAWAFDEESDVLDAFTLDQEAVLVGILKTAWKASLARHSEQPAAPEVRETDREIAERFVTTYCGKGNNNAFIARNLAFELAQVRAEHASHMEQAVAAERKVWQSRESEKYRQALLERGVAAEKRADALEAQLDALAPQVAKADEIVEACAAECDKARNLGCGETLVSQIRGSCHTSDAELIRALKGTFASQPDSAAVAKADEK
jgi:hypothetical protein